MKKLLKVLLVMGWSFNLFASEAEPAFLALDVLNNPTTKNLVTILENKNMTNRGKVVAFLIIINGLTPTPDEKESIRISLNEMQLFSGNAPAAKPFLRASFAELCSKINDIIKKINAPENFFSENLISSGRASADEVSAVWAFIRTFLYRFFDPAEFFKMFEEMENIPLDNIIRACAP